MPSSARSNYDALQELLSKGQAYLDEWTEAALFEVKPAASGWSIGHHLYHIALANASVPKLIERLQAGTLGDEDQQGDPIKLQLIRDGIVPRGRKAPERAQPPADLAVELLQRDFKRMTRATQRLEPSLDALDQISRRFPHMYYGSLSAEEWIRFMFIHTRHHMNIIGEIEES